MENQYVIVEKMNERISKVILNRPDKHNALNLEMMKMLCKIFEKLEDSTCSVVILEANGKTFCAGLDLEQTREDELGQLMTSQLAQLFAFLHKTRLVTIAALQGHALAGGGGLAVSCDFVLLARGAKIGFPEVHRGLIAAQVAVILLRQLNQRHVRELLLAGNLIESQRALEMGLVNQVVDVDLLKQESLRLANQLLKGAPTALRETKCLLDRLQGDDFSKNLQLAISFYHRARISQEGQEGMTSFLEKRPPFWIV